VNPDLAITLEIHKYLAEKYTLNNGICTSGKIALTEFYARHYPRVIGLSLPQIKEMFPNMLVAAISRKGKVIIPHGNDTIKQEDILTLSVKKRKF
jgi:trk system potassium uptake protein TrkA